jgi:hypothetical protein
MSEVEDDLIEGGRRLKLGDIRRTGAKSDFSVPVLTGFNMGNMTVSLTMKMETFRDYSDIANSARVMETTKDSNDIAQRPLDENHAKHIAIYMLRGLLASVRKEWLAENRDIPDELDDLLSELGTGPYQGLQPFTGNIRKCKPGGTDLDLVERSDGKLVLFLRQGQLIYVVDGQHRRRGYERLVSWLREMLASSKYVSTRKGGIHVPDDREDLRLTTAEAEIFGAVLELARSHFTVDVTVHLGLDAEQERQLFHDLNNLGKKPDAALAQAFDHSNPVSIFIRKEIEGSRLLGNIMISDTGSKKGRKPEENNAAVIYRDDLVSANAALFAGATNQAGIMTSAVIPHVDYGRCFWEAVAMQDHFGEEGWSEKTLLSEPVMIKALANLAYTFHGSREQNHELRERFILALRNKELNFSREEPLWGIYRLSHAERDELDPKLDDYLTPDEGMKSYANWQGSRLTSFAQNTRDIARYLGDLMRWKLGLPPRPGVASLKARLISQGKMAAKATVAEAEPAAAA